MRTVVTEYLNSDIKRNPIRHLLLSLNTLFDRLLLSKNIIIPEKYQKLILQDQ